MWRIIIVFVILTLIPAGAALGHPPSGIELEFDITVHELEIIAHHTVKDSLKHYVDTIVVKLNGEEVIEQKFWSQADSQGQRAEYVIIDARLGDEIEVIAGCNISGRKKGSLVVEEKVEQEPEQIEDDQ